MDFLHHIDWGTHDGVNLSMLNDFMRNRFYDRAISQQVNNRRCIDVGFGTGLLTIMALRHGAQHVTAYESDENRYELGMEVIRRLSLESRVKLINERYDYSMLAEHPDVEVLFTETVNGNLWWEGMFNNIPAEPTSVQFIPGDYCLELLAITVSDDLAQGLTTNIEGPIEEFYPGVDMDVEFVNCVNEMIARTNERDFSPRAAAAPTVGLQVLDNKTNTPWAWIPYMRLAAYDSEVIARYQLNVGQATVTTRDSYVDHVKPFDFRASRLTLTIDTAGWRDTNVVLVPRVSLLSGQHRLILDTGHWGPVESPVLLVRPNSDLVVSHSLRSGSIKYQYRE